jgi:homopolymeric O-antigen transport system ATP-binding protein
MRAIEVRNLSKKYQIYGRPWEKLREMLALGPTTRRQEFWALQDVSFAINSGETLGIIGENGSGKSTLLQIVAGIMRQTRGDCFVQGKVAALLELGSGFNPEFTGRENVFMNGAILGFDTSKMEERFEAIAHFAEIGSFMDQPVKTYSSGMFMRLAFAVAINVDPDVLLIDEALAVGDLIFQHRCMHRMNQLRDQGKTILLVTHDLAAVAKFCDRAILLDKGRLLEDGKPDLVVQKYRALVFERERRYGSPDGTEPPDSFVHATIDKGEVPVARSIPNMDHRFGNGEAVVLGVDLLDGEGNPTREVFGGQKVVVRVSARFTRDINRPIIGYTLRDRMGVEISACNTSYAGQILPPARGGQIFTSDFCIVMPHMAAGSYSISPAVAKGNVLKHDMCDWVDNAIIFSLKSEYLVYGMIKMDVDVQTYSIDDSSNPTD